MALFNQNKNSQPNGGRLRTDRSIADQLGLKPNELVSPAQAAQIRAISEQHREYVRATEDAFKRASQMEADNTKAHGAQIDYAGTLAEEQGKRANLASIHQIRRAAIEAHTNSESKVAKNTRGVMSRYFG